ncbi:unnamed protein product, partial [Rangifer tarandus platyrhynchus]
ILNLCFSVFDTNFGHLRIQPSVPIFTQDSGHRTGKRSVFIPIPKKGNTKEGSNYCTI